MSASTEGVRAAPRGTLVDRALRRLRQDAADSLTLARDVLGLARASRAIADRVVVALLGADPRVRQMHDGRWALATRADGSPRLASCTFAVVDVETTGTRYGRGDRVTELAIVTLSGGEVDVAFETLVNPERPIPSFVQSLTRITDDMVRNQPTFDEIADDVLATLAGRVFVAHNAPFDWGFLSSELRRTRDLDLEGAKLCTVRLARRLLPGLRSRGLDSVAAFLGIEIAERHRARGDALATAHILRHLLARAEEQGAETLTDLQGLGRRGRRKKSALPTPVEEA
ncbi:MAG: 3'-5' exonuclease [Gemmatimonadota bacterium]|nr:MAG: 3'-5' exonuclease [Gemmatimonadota bacterium]